VSKHSRIAGDKKPVPVTAAQEHRTAMHNAIDRVCTAWSHAALDISSIGFPVGRGFDAGTGGGPSVRVETAHARGALPAVYERVPATGVEIAAFANPDIGYAVGWVAELHDITLAVLTAAWPLEHVVIEWQPEPVSVRLHAAVDTLAATWAADRPGHPRVREDLYRLADAAARHWPEPPKKGTQMGGVTVGERTSTVENCGLCRTPVDGGRNDAGQLLLRRIDGVSFHNTGGDGHEACFWLVWRQRRSVA
jgi:hypothetical protein